MILKRSIVTAWIGQIVPHSINGQRNSLEVCIWTHWIDWSIHIVMAQWCLSCCRATNRCRETVAMQLLLCSSPSPEPIYNQEGKRLNTREYRTRKKLEEERHHLVQRVLKANPDYKPPQDYRYQQSFIHYQVLFQSYLREYCWIYLVTIFRMTCCNMVLRKMLDA